jgi:ectoine hydroxylase-related dioxygenase (phytanoyl-CoA dioxygenase family)
MIDEPGVKRFPVPKGELERHAGHGEQLSFVDTYRDKGWLSMRGIFPHGLIDGVRASYAKQVVALQAEDGGFVSHRQVGAKRKMFSVQLTDSFLDPSLYANPMLIGVLTMLLGKDLLIDNFTCVTALPGAEEQELHFDHVDLFPEEEALRGAVPPYAVTAAIPLIDLDEDTGTTRLLSGSHLGKPSDRSEVPYLHRGDCFLMDYRLWHHGTANRSEVERPILYIVFARSWFTDMRNFNRQPRLRMTPEDFLKVPRQHRALFRRLAARGAFDRSEAELLGQ